MELFQVRGLGAKKIKLLYDELGVSSIQQLKQVCLDNKITTVKGFTSKTQNKILEEIQRLNEAKKYLLLSIAMKFGNELVQRISEMTGVVKCEFTGELRRIREVISEIELLVLVKDFSSFKKELNREYEVSESKGDLSYSKLTFYISGTIICSIYVVTNPEQFTWVLFKTTGSEEFLTKLNLPSKPLVSQTEEEIFKELKQIYVIPEMREGIYFDHTKRLKANSDLSLNDFKGFLHFHTNYSDGLNTLEEMADACVKLGFEYFAVCDHSKSAFYANGLSEKRVLEQKSLIEVLNKKKEHHIFHGVECDILSDGKLDFDNEFLKIFDFVVASVHSVFGLDEDVMTRRIIKAVENQYVDLLGHPTGRLLLARDAYKVNMTKVIDACTKNDVAIEINASPHRLDLDWRLVYYAREKGCKLSINPDSHSVQTISEIEYGIKIGRKGGLQSKEVINCYDIGKFRKYLTRKVNRKL